jgi:hypothetical protein
MQDIGFWAGNCGGIHHHRSDRVKEMRANRNHTRSGAPETHFVSATNTVLNDAEHASVLILPIMGQP